MQQEKLSVHQRVSLRIGHDFVRGNVARTWQDRAEHLHRQMMRSNLRCIENEITVITCSQTAFNTEKVSKDWHVSTCLRRRKREPSPLGFMLQRLYRDET